MTLPAKNLDATPNPAPGAPPRGDRPGAARILRLEDGLPPARTAACDELRPLPDAAVVAHLVEHHHAYARRALPYIVALLAKVAGFHGKRNAKLSALYDAGVELAETLEARLDAEERELFPALLATAAGREAVARELDELCRHHRRVRLLLARTRWLADDFSPPEWAGRSYRVLLEELEALEEDVLEHVHLESHVLLPRLSSRWPEPC
jgi:regulator of cell morphogenesis and NO signaling